MYRLLYTMFHSTTCNMADSGPHHTVLHLVKLQSICIMKTPDPLSQIDHRSQVTKCPSPSRQNGKIQARSRRGKKEKGILTISSHFTSM